MIQFLPLIFLFLTLNLTAKPMLENQTCQICHPKIYKEYKNSMHQKSSIYNDEIHKMIWKLHPLSKENNYTCAKCHTPSDHELAAGKTTLHKNAIQQSEPISCQYCHKIERIEEHQKANTNILSSKEKQFFTANQEKKGEKLEYKDEKIFFGLFAKKVGSPYHDIDYSNEAFYTGDLCMGCHSHKRNSNNFLICDLEVKQSDSKETCITCHMPKVLGTMANQKATKTHSFHGNTALVSKPTLLAKYIHFSLEQDQNGFYITLENKANHTLVPHPLRVAKLKLSIQRGKNIITLKPQTFSKVIGKDGKPTMPWLADEIIKDTTIKAFEKRALSYDTKLQKGDVVTATFGYHIINENSAKILQINDKKLLKFIILSQQRFTI